MYRPCYCLGVLMNCFGEVVVWNFRVLELDYRFGFHHGHWGAFPSCQFRLQTVHKKDDFAQSRQLAVSVSSRARLNDASQHLIVCKIVWKSYDRHSSLSHLSYQAALLQSFIHLAVHIFSCGNWRFNLTPVLHVYLKLNSALIPGQRQIHSTKFSPNMARSETYISLGMCLQILLELLVSSAINLLFKKVF